MKTKIYDAWTEKVKQFVLDITDLGATVFDFPEDTELYERVYKWLDTPVATDTFRNSQGQFFAPHIPEYKSAKCPCTETTYALSQQQVQVGFDAWFLALKQSFPELDTLETNKKYAAFRASCTGAEYNCYFTTRTALTTELVQRGKLKDIHFVIDLDKTLIEHIHANLAAMEQYAEANADKASIPRGPSSPSFHKKAPSSEIPTGITNNDAAGVYLSK